MERLVYTDWYALGGDSLRMKRLGNRLSGRLADGATFERIVDADSGRLLLEISEEKGVPIDHEGVEREPVALEGIFLRVPSLYMNSALPLGGIVFSLFALALTNHRPLLLPLAGFSLHAALGLLASLPIGASNPLPAPVELLWTPLSSLALLAFVSTMPTQRARIRPKPRRRRRSGR